MLTGREPWAEKMFESREQAYAFLCTTKETPRFPAFLTTRGQDFLGRCLTRSVAECVLLADPRCVHAEILISDPMQKLCCSMRGSRTRQSPRRTNPKQLVRSEPVLYVMLLRDHPCVIAVNFQQFVQAWQAECLPWAGAKQGSESPILIVKPKAEERYVPQFPDEIRVPAVRAIPAELVHAGSLGAGTRAESAKPLSMTGVIQSFLSI